MPQMAPIGWLSLFVIFSIAFMMFSMMNYYSILPNSPKSSSSEKSSSTSMKWKW